MALRDEVMIYRDHRYDTFHQPSSSDNYEWKNETEVIENIDLLADSGFYYSPTKRAKRRVVCAYCHRIENVKTEKQAENITKTHLKKNPKCPMSLIIETYKKFQTSNKWPSIPTFQEPLCEESIQFRKTFFTSYPLDKLDYKPNSDSLSKAGFVYLPRSMEDDRVSCMFCKCSLDYWEDEDDPIEEHEKNKPDYCYFLDQYQKQKITDPETLVVPPEIEVNDIELQLESRTKDESKSTSSTNKVSNKKRDDKRSTSNTQRNFGEKERYVDYWNKVPDNDLLQEFIDVSRASKPSSSKEISNSYNERFEKKDQLIASSNKSSEKLANKLRNVENGFTGESAGNPHREEVIVLTKREINSKDENNKPRASNDEENKISESFVQEIENEDQNNGSEFVQSEDKDITNQDIEPYQEIIKINDDSQKSNLAHDSKDSNSEEEIQNTRNLEELVEMENNDDSSSISEYLESEFPTMEQTDESYHELVPKPKKKPESTGSKTKSSKKRNVQDSNEPYKKPKITVQKIIKNSDCQPVTYDSTDDNMEYDDENVEKLEKKIVKTSIEPVDKNAFGKKGEISAPPPIKFTASMNRKDSPKKKKLGSRPNILDHSFDAAEEFANPNKRWSTLLSSPKRSISISKSPERSLVDKTGIISSHRAQNNDISNHENEIDNDNVLPGELVDLHQSTEKDIVLQERAQEKSRTSDIRDGEDIGRQEVEIRDDIPILDVSANVNNKASHDVFKINNLDIGTVENEQQESEGNISTTSTARPILADNEKNESFPEEQDQVVKENQSLSNQGENSNVKDHQGSSHEKLKRSKISVSIGDHISNKLETETVANKNDLNDADFAKSVNSEVRKTSLEKMHSKLHHETAILDTKSAIETNPKNVLQHNLNLQKSSPVKLREFSPLKFESAKFDASTPNKFPMTSPLAMNSSLINVKYAKIWEKKSTSQFTEKIHNLKSSAKELSDLASSKYDLHDDLNGELTRFIAEMPEEEENMTIKQWIEHCAVNCRDIVLQTCGELNDFIVEEYDRAISLVENLVVEE